MNKWLSLSTKKEKVLPCSLGGHEIDADFRTVLRCIRVLTDEDLKEHEKIFLFSKWFFKGELVEDGLSLFLAFAKSGQSEVEDDDDEPLMDYEQDSDAIYASFLQQYGIDLFEVEYLHWYKFRALLSGLGDGTVLRDRMRIRGMETDKLSLDDRAKVEKAKRAVALEVKMSKEEADLQKRLEECLAEGGDPAEIVRKMNEL